MRVLMLQRGNIDDPEFCGIFLQRTKMIQYVEKAKKLGIIRDFLEPIEVDLERDFFIPDNSTMFMICMCKTKPCHIVNLYWAISKTMNIIKCNRMHVHINAEGTKAVLYLWSISADMALKRAEQIKATMDHENLWTPRGRFDFSVMA